MSSTSMCRLRGVRGDENINNSKACCMLGSLEADVETGFGVRGQHLWKGEAWAAGEVEL